MGQISHPNFEWKGRALKELGQMTKFQNRTLVGFFEMRKYLHSPLALISIVYDYFMIISLK